MQNRYHIHWLTISVLGIKFFVGDTNASGHTEFDVITFERKRFLPERQITHANLRYTDNNNNNQQTKRERRETMNEYGTHYGKEITDEENCESERDAS